VLAGGKSVERMLGVEPIGRANTHDVHVAAGDELTMVACDMRNAKLRTELGAQCVQSMAGGLSHRHTGQMRPRMVYYGFHMLLASVTGTNHADTE
jgi:hypothetical protein